MDKRLQEKRLLLGAIFLIFGGFLLLGNMNLVSGPIYFKIKNLFWHWPMILVVIGLIHLVLKDQKFPGLIILLIGTVFMLPHWFDIPYNFKEIFWPALFIIAGITILFRGNKHKARQFCKDEKMDDQDMIDDLAFFGGGDKIITSQNFKGGKITCVFGGLNLNFLRAKLSQGKIEIDIFAVFGGMKMIIPEEWDLKINVTSVFGGFSDKRNISPTALQNKQGELVIKGTAIFGGGEIKNF